MKPAPKRDTQRKAAQAARRSAKGPSTSPTPRGGAAAARRAHNPKAAGSIPAPATKPRNLKPAPPVTDCLKCSKIATVRRELAAALRLVEKMESEERTRIAAAAAGVGGCLSDEDIEAAKERVFHPLFEQVLQVAVNIALSPAEEAGDRLKAVMIVKDEVAGKVTDKVDHTTKGKALGGCMLVTDFPVAGGPTPAAAPDPESGD